MHKGYSSFFLIIGIVFMFLFFLPCLKSIINLGNLTGMGISILLILYGLFFSNINRTITLFWKKGVGKLCISFTAIICSIILVLTIILTFFMINAAVKKPPKNVNTTAVILGCAVHGKNPSLMLKRRLDAALHYLEENPSANAILSGGKGSGEDISEAQCMFDYLTANGISKDRLYLEDRSKNTKENIQYSKEILQDIQKSSDIVIITNEFHQYRAGILARNEGLNVYSINGKTVSYLLPTYYIRELYAILNQWITTELSH